MRRKIVISPRQDEVKEEQMRPSRFLGYDRDSLGMYALGREMFEVAESQFRRAAYLNPFEARFKQHLAWCLYKQENYPEAKRCIIEALRQDPHDKDSSHILLKIEEKMASGQTR
ncbi:MAG: tetratricopeptide repeat protein [Spirochaetia bacterium]